MNQEQNEQTERQISKQERIKQLLESTKKFQQDTKQNISFEPNIPQLVLFPSDWYLDYDSMINEQIEVYHKPSVEAVEYAEKFYRMRNKLETPEKGDSYSATIYRGLKLPNTTFPDLQREWRVTSKKAVEAVNNALAEASMKTEGDILLLITKKVGDTRYQVNWDVEYKAQ